ncbi:tachylectin-related carbohydrate-binding protein [Amycolatopsis aidingensis]|uniref:tachylectin-related carbohydrate-binding protein n=1 Tax=Amycolatopsis aidingensis TaxID=2842453 RepID=UPI001C0CE6AE|nr:tachylectin-related carbohydrate-binding protein [Amycolatopsis aidingensis]
MPLLAVTSAALVAAPGPAAVAQESIQCQDNVAIFYQKPDTGLDIDRHKEPETGARSWTGRKGVGFGWDGGAVAGPDGLVYAITPEGEVHKFRRLQNKWDNGGVSITIKTGWTDPGYRNKITVDSIGDFYVILSDNTLRWYRYDENSEEWSERTLAFNWGRFDMITAGGNGVLYTRTSNGDLYRHQYHAESQRWIERDNKVGNGGWQRFSSITSAGADVIYAVDRDSHDMLWYRYLGDGEWAEGPKTVGSIPPDWHMTATSNACELLNEPLPEPVTVPLRDTAPNAIVEGEDGRLHHFYVDSYGRFVHGEQRNTDDITIIDFHLIPGERSTDIPTAAVRQDGSIMAAALGQDGVTRGGAFPDGANNWPETVSMGGWTSSPVAYVPRHDDQLRAFVVDPQGCLWETDQYADGMKFMPWWLHGGCGSFASVAPTISQSDPDSYRLTLLKRDGRYQTISNVDGDWGTGWEVLYGDRFTGRAATALNGDRLHIFAKDEEGRIKFQVEEADGSFPGTWTEIPGLTATGTPAASVTGNGLVQVAARAADGYVYVTEQLNPGSNAYRDWQRLRDSRTGASYPSATDPASIDRASGSVAFTYRDSDGTVYAFESVTPQIGSRSTADTAARTGYLGGPASKPRFEK